MMIPCSVTRHSRDSMHQKVRINTALLTVRDAGKRLVEGRVLEVADQGEARCRGQQPLSSLQMLTKNKIEAQKRMIEWYIMFQHFFYNYF